MTESTGLIDLAGQFVSTSSPTLTQTAPVSGIKAILNGTDLVGLLLVASIFVITNKSSADKLDSGKLGLSLIHI